MINVDLYMSPPEVKGAFKVFDDHHPRNINILEWVHPDHPQPCSKVSLSFFKEEDGRAFKEAWLQHKETL